MHQLCMSVRIETVVDHYTKETATAEMLRETVKIVRFAIAHHNDSLLNLRGDATNGVPLGDITT